MPRRPRTSTGSRQRGRPALDDANRRSRTIGVRLSPLELEALDAVRGNLARGAWLRDAALSTKGRKQPQLPPPPVNFETYQQLSGAANNLNQLIRQVHKTQDVETSWKTIVKSLIALDELVRKVQTQVLVRD